jgi:hypothetical protein
MNRQVTARRIRQHLERRLAQLLDCKREEVPSMKLGTIVHFLFLLTGDQEEIGGFHTSMAALLQLLGHEIVWDIEPKEESEEVAPEVVN